MRLLSPYYLHITKNLRLFYSHITPILCPYCAHIGLLPPLSAYSFVQTTIPTSDERFLLPKSAVNSHWFHAVTYMVFCVCDTKRIKSCYILAPILLFSRCGPFEFSMFMFLLSSQLPARSSKFWVANPASQSSAVSSVGQLKRKRKGGPCSLAQAAGRWCQIPSIQLRSSTGESDGPGSPVAVWQIGSCPVPAFLPSDSPASSRTGCPHRHLT